MKFLSLAVAALLSPLSDGAKTLSGTDLNSMLQSGKIDAKALLRHAMPYNKKNRLRKLSEDSEEEEGQYADSYGEGYLAGNDISGKYSVTFNSCVSLSVEEDWDEIDNFEYIEPYLADGSIKSVRSYVLFNICETQSDCIYGAENDDENTYMVELSTFVEAMLNYMPDQKDSVCEGCENQADYCESFYQYGFVNNNNIDYTKAYYFYQGQKYQLIDCDACTNFGCYDDEDVYETNGWDNVAGWVGDIAECYETGATWNDIDLNAGWMCNAAGTGMEIALFVDEDCTLYNSNKSYRKTLESGDEQWEYYAKSADVISYMFANPFDCYGGDIVYVNLFQTVYTDEFFEAAEECDDGEDCGEAAEEEEAEDKYECDANNACSALFGNGNFEATALSTCAVNYAEEEEEGSQEEEEEAEYDFGFTYDIYQEYAEDDDAICYYVEELFNGAGVSQAQGAYNEDASGTLYDYSDSSNSDGGSTNSGKYFPSINALKAPKTIAPKTMHPATITFITLLTAAGVFSALYGANRVRKAIKLKQITDMKDSKDVPFLS
jgi:hypothetical protein